MMFDRHLIGDIALAILLAVPTLALSRPQAPTADEAISAPLAEQASRVDQSSTDRRFSLEG